MGVVNICGVCPVGVAMVPDGNPKKLEPMKSGHNDKKIAQGRVVTILLRS